MSGLSDYIRHVHMTDAVGRKKAKHEAKYAIDAKKARAETEKARTETERASADRLVEQNDRLESQRRAPVARLNACKSTVKDRDEDRSLQGAIDRLEGFLVGGGRAGATPSEPTELRAENTRLREQRASMQGAAAADAQTRKRKWDEVFGGKERVFAAMKMNKEAETRLDAEKEELETQKRIKLEEINDVAAREVSVSARDKDVARREQDVTRREEAVLRGEEATLKSEEAIARDHTRVLGCHMNDAEQEAERPELDVASQDVDQLDAEIEALERGDDESPGYEQEIYGQVVSDQRYIATWLPDEQQVAKHIAGHLRELLGLMPAHQHDVEQPEPQQRHWVAHQPVVEQLDVATGHRLDVANDRPLAQRRPEQVVQLPTLSQWPSEQPIDAAEVLEPMQQPDFAAEEPASVSEPGAPVQRAEPAEPRPTHALVPIAEPAPSPVPVAERCPRSRFVQSASLTCVLTGRLLRPACSAKNSACLERVSLSRVEWIWRSSYRKTQSQFIGLLLSSSSAHRPTCCSCWTQERSFDHLA